MAFVDEYVPREDWDLYNSFELVKKSIDIGQKKVANEHSGWIVDRERDILGTVTILLNGETLDEKPIVSGESIQKKNLLWIYRQLWKSYAL